MQFLFAGAHAVDWGRSGFCGLPVKTCRSVCLAWGQRLGAPNKDCLGREVYFQPQIISSSKWCRNSIYVRNLEGALPRPSPLSPSEQAATHGYTPGPRWATSLQPRWGQVDGGQADGCWLAFSPRQKSARARRALTSISSLSFSFSGPQAPTPIWFHILFYLAVGMIFLVDTIFCMIIYKELQKQKRWNLEISLGSGPKKKGTSYLQNDRYLEDI